MEEQFHPEIEREIAELTAEIKAENSPEKGKELIRERINQRIYGSPLVNGLQTTQQTEPGKQDDKTTKSALPNYAKDLPPESKILAEKLIDYAWHKGLNAAIKEVRKSDPITMDIFHDAITEKLYQAFKQRGIIK